MLIPTDGFGWVIDDREVAGRGQSECMFSLTLNLSLPFAVFPYVDFGGLFADRVTGGGC